MFVRLNLETYEATPLLPGPMLNELQQTLEIRKPATGGEQ
jgi:hypothetical protein